MFYLVFRPSILLERIFRFFLARFADSIDSLACCHRHCYSVCFYIVSHFGCFLSVVIIKIPQKLNFNYTIFGGHLTLISLACLFASRLLLLASKHFYGRHAIESDAKKSYINKFSAIRFFPSPRTCGRRTAKTSLKIEMIDENVLIAGANWTDLVSGFFFHSSSLECVV